MSDSIPQCEASNPFPRQPSISIPDNACDCHAHVFSSLERYPFVPDRTYTPPDAPPGAYLHMHQVLGIKRGVLVQPSVYGADNSLQVDTLNYLKAQGMQYKGVAVVSGDISDSELDELEESGHCGVRMNLLFRGGIQWQDVQQLAERLAWRNWHLQFLVDVSEFDQLEERVKALPVPVIVDHMGHMPTGKGIDHPGFQALLRLMSEGHAWTKLSGAYRITAEQQPPYEDVVPFAQALIEANPDQCVWGSDWPHPHFSIPMPNAGDLLSLLALWAPDERLRQRILVENPSRLYRF